MHPRDGRGNTFVVGFAGIQPVSGDSSESLRIQLPLCWGTLGAQILTTSATRIRFLGSRPRVYFLWAGGVALMVGSDGAAEGCGRLAVRKPSFLKGEFFGSAAGASFCDN